MKFTKVFAFMALAGLAGSAYATNGYFAHGYGMSAKGMGGAGIAYPQDTLAAATNPAGMVHLGNRMDIGLEIFAPDRGFTYAGGSPDGNGSGAMESWFPIPEFGYNRMINSNMSFGVSVFGNGGMNTTYGDGDHPFATFPEAGDTGTTVGIDLMQMFIAPTIAYKVNQQLSVGATLNLIAQSFESKGLGGFGQANNGKDYSYGAGLRVGGMYQINNAVTVGATYQTKGNMSKLKDYAAMFPNGGEFDIPANYGVGIAVKASDKLDIALDVMRIEYEGVDVTGNKALFSLFQANQHGFGWEDQTVVKLGVAYKYNSGLILRAGVNYGEQPIDVSNTLVADDITSDLNTLAPGIVETHLTLGFTKSLSADTSITGSYMHAFNKEVDGVGGFLGASTLEMSQNAFGLSYNKKF
ncbi:MAG: outer membrane protein transport protein [Gammaproteobacteria bacterium]|nr:outer membrane protein transport protein [Gammaproteobacteria bacterium]